jgi:hypothetical protein
MRLLQGAGEAFFFYPSLITSLRATLPQPPPEDPNSIEYPSQHRYLTQHQRGPSTTTVLAKPKHSSKHKTTFIVCCAALCDQTFFRKDHLTQHMRNRHQKSNADFHCPVGGCTNRLLSLDELFMHMKQSSHQGDVHFTSIKNAAEKPKCSCGDGLIISGRCKACGFHLV